GTHKRGNSKQHDADQRIESQQAMRRDEAREKRTGKATDHKAKHGETQPEGCVFLRRSAREASKADIETGDTHLGANIKKLRHDSPREVLPPQGLGYR